MTTYEEQLVAFGLTKGEMYIPRTGYTFEYLVAGPVAGPPILMLHGFPSTAYMWRYNMQALARAGYRVVAPNQRGYSPKARPPGYDVYGDNVTAQMIRDYSISELVQDVFDFADYLGWPEFHLATHDWGSVVGWNLVLLYPQRVKSFVYSAVPHPGANDAVYRSAIGMTQLVKSLYVFLLFTEGHQMYMLEGVPSAGVSPGLQGLYAYHKSPEDKAVSLSLMNPERYRAATAWYRSIVAGFEDGAVPADVLFALPPDIRTALLAYFPKLAHLSTLNAESSTSVNNLTTTVPTLGLFGTNDVSLELENAIETHKYVLGEYKYVQVNGEGHWYHETSPDAVNTALLNFYSDKSIPQERLAYTIGEEQSPFDGGAIQLALGSITSRQELDDYFATLSPDAIAKFNPVGAAS